MVYLVGLLVLRVCFVGLGDLVGLLRVVCAYVVLRLWFGLGYDLV